MGSKIRPYNFKSMVIIAYEIVKVYFSVSASFDKSGVVKKFLNHILWGIKNIYQQLSILDKINVNKELKDFKSFFKNNNYLKDEDIKKVLKRISIIQIQDYIRKILPKILKIF